MLTELYQLREKAGMTQRELAQKASVAKGTISNIETGIRIPRIDTVYRLAFALDMSPEVLFLKLGQDEPFSKR